MKLSFRLTCALAACMLACSTARADLVFDNTTGDISTRFNPGLLEVGDQIILAGGARYVTNFQIQYWGENFLTANAQLRLYSNTGDPSPGGPLKPAAIAFYDSGIFSIGPTNRATLIFDFSLAPVLVPDEFTWTIQFSSLGAGSAGVDIYTPPGVGTDPNTYWENTGADWLLKFNPGTNMNFAARISAVPEPGTMALLGLGGAAALIALRRSRKR